nr:MAG TPA_asm: hypothetical protein [Caudoviricetes sp.]
MRVEVSIGVYRAACVPPIIKADCIARTTFLPCISPTIVFRCLFA